MLQWRVAEVCQRIEHGFEIIGVAAIEDRLQVRPSFLKKNKNKKILDKACLPSWHDSCILGKMLLLDLCFIVSWSMDFTILLFTYTHTHIFV